MGSKNKIISIGYISGYKCYLNITEEEAIKKFCEIENKDCFLEDQKIYTKEDVLNNGNSIDIIEFDEMFGAYEIYEDENYGK